MRSLEYFYCYFLAKEQLIVEVPGNIDLDELKKVKFIEVRGICGESGDILMR